MAAKNKSNELKIIRIFDAPVRLVWEAWNDPKHAAKWWGPRGFTLTSHSKELKVGGIWHYTMHGPDGKDYVNKTKYLEVVKYERLVYDHGGNDEHAPMFRVTVNFSEDNGKTKMDMTMTLPTPEAAEETRKFVKKAGGESTWDRLAEYLEQEQFSKDKFFINRSFEAEIETIFEMFSNPLHISKWLAPVGFEMEYLNADIKTGGSSSFSMFNKANLRMYCSAKYLEVMRPNRIVYTQQFIDEEGNVSRQPLSPTWPETMLMTITLTEEGPELTRVTIVTEVVGDVAKVEAETFHNGKAGMTSGWTGAFDKLEDYLFKNR